MTKKECIQRLKNVDLSCKRTVQEIYDDVYGIISDYGDPDLIDSLDIEYLDEEQAEEFASNMLCNSGLAAAANCLSDLREFNGIYHVDGYNNLEDITRSHVEGLVDELLDALEEEDDNDD